MRTVHVLTKWTAVVSRDLANVRAFSRAPCTLARLSNSTEKVVWVEHISTNSFREKKKAPSHNNRFLRTWLHQLFTHATRISSKQSRPASELGQRTLKTTGKLVRARSEKSTRGVVSNGAACVSNDVKEDPPISGRECHRRERRPRQSNATAQGNTKGANWPRFLRLHSNSVCVCVWLARAPMCRLSRCFRWVMVPFTTLPRLSCSPGFPRLRGRVRRRQSGSAFFATRPPLQ